MTMDRSSTVLPFDPERADASEELAAIGAELARQRRAVLLVAGSAARQERWADRAAITVAQAFSGCGRRPVLADLGFDDAVLHELVDLPNIEGVGDIFFFGASPEHVIQPVASRSFDLIPAGGYVPDSTVLEHRAWPRLLAQLDASGALFLGYVPASSPGLDSLARTVGNVILLAREDEAERLRAALPPGASVLKVLIPRSEGPSIAARPPIDTGTARPLAARTDFAEPATKDEAAEAFERIRIPREGERDALIADLRARQRAALTRPPAGAPTAHSTVQPRPIVGGPRALEKPALTEPHVPRAAPRPRQVRRSPREILPKLVIPRSRMVITGAIVLLLSALAGIWQLGRGTLGARREVSDTARPDAPPASRQSALTGEPAGVALPYSVAIEAHQDLPTAVRRVESLSRVEPAIGFYIAPILVDSALYYRVMAGPVMDSTAAAQVMASLIRRGHKTGGSDWDIRATPYAFRLGEYELREQAEQRMKELQQLDIPSYVLEVPFTNGPPRYYLYSGAYSGPAEADVMRKLLRSAGLNETLVERTGRSPT
jgi:hypothetical protein